MSVKLYRNGAWEEMEASEGGNLYALLRDAGIAIEAPCGGRCFCGKCLVQVEGGSEVLAAERDFLTPAQIASGERLACAVTVQGDMKVWTAREKYASIQIEGGLAGYSFDPPVRVLEVALRKPTLEDPSDDFSRLQEAVGPLAVPEAPVLGGLKKPYAVLYDGKNLLAMRGDRASYGVAIDIGTTTVVAYLMDLTDGRQLDAATALNAQRSFGADVISRCAAAATAQGLLDLTRAMRSQLRALIGELCGRIGLANENIHHIAIVGNTVMMHLLLGAPVDGIAVSPFAPAIAQGFDIRAEALELGCPRAMATLLPSIAGYIGADTVAAAMACGLDLDGPPRLLTDIGTNGEMVLAANGKLLCCSTAAGPAFEGAHIACGVGGVNGAISRVIMDNGNLRTETIGDEDPIGLCGSGLVDAVAALVSAGAVDETGRLDEEYLSDRHFELDGKAAFRLEGEVYLSQKDLREVQLAKSAIAAGIEILLSEAGLNAGDIVHTYLAGGFGSHIDPASACRIGLLPVTLLPTIQPVGNAAGAGARVALLERNARERAEALRRRVRAIELSLRPDFQDLYIDQMMFPS